MDKTTLDERQTIAAQLWAARRHNKLTEDQIAEQLGISRRTLFTWKQLPAWKTYVSDMVREVAQEHRGEVIDALITQCKKGNVRAITVFLQYTGDLKNEPSVVVNNEADRSNEALEADIAKLKADLGMDVGIPVKPNQKQLEDLQIQALQRNWKGMTKPTGTRTRKVI